MTGPPGTVRLGLALNKKMVMTLRILLLLLLPAWANALEPTVIQGQWAAIQERQDATDRYFFLTVNADLSGVLVRTRGEETVTRRFGADDSRNREAYLEADLTGGETVILWAWQQNNGLRRVNGLLFDKGRQAPVRNILPVPLEHLGPQHELRQHPRIGAWTREYPYQEDSADDD
jgi:hypothetical protein